MEAAPVTELLSRHAWFLFVVVTCVNAVVWWHRGQPIIAKHPERRERYLRLVRGFLFWGNLPWLVMGLGIVVGSVPSTFHYFNPRNGPFVIAWFVTVIGLWILTFIWLFFRRGAETLIEHPGLLNLPVSSPWAIKIIFLVSVSGGIIAVTAMLLGNIQTPNFH